MIIGKCMLKCPPSELKSRRKEHLIHPLESDDATYNKPAHARVADPDNVIKCFKRSAAGQRLADPGILRPPEVLLDTTQYLFDVVLFRTHVPWSLVYAFCLDRLRAVRQDLSIQQTRNSTSLAILRRCAAFHLYAQYRSRDCSLDDFDPHINSQHLQQCLSDALRTQEALYYSRSAASHSHVDDHRSTLSASPSHVADHRSTLYASLTHVADHRSTLSASLTHVADHRSTLSASLTHVADHRSTLSASPSHVADHRSTLSSSPTHVADQRSTLSASPTHVADHRSTLSASPSHVADQRRTLSSSPTHVADQRSTLSASPSHVADHRSTLSASPLHVADQRSTLSSLPTHVADQRSTLSASPSHVADQRSTLYASLTHVTDDQNALFEAANLLYNIDQDDTYRRILQLRVHSQQLRLAVMLRRAWSHNNYIRCFRLCPGLCPLLRLAVYRHLALLRTRALSCLSAAYQSRTLSVPLALIGRWLDYDDVIQLQHDVTSVGLTLRPEQPPSVVFGRKLGHDLATLKQKSWRLLDSVRNVDGICSDDGSTPT